MNDVVEGSVIPESPEAPRVEEPAAPIAPTAPAVVTPKAQELVSADLHVHDNVMVEGVIHLWEKQTEHLIKNQKDGLAQAMAQTEATMAQLDANNGRGSSDWSQLEQRKMEIARQIEHVTNSVVVGDLVWRAKRKGMITVGLQTDWNHTIERHAVVIDGKVSYMLPRSPIK